MAEHVLEWSRKGRRPIDHFQVFGERRCGTNYVNQLLTDNLVAESTTRYGWKHGYPTMPCVARSGLLVIVVREPFDWLSSLHNRPFAISHEGLGFSEFIRSEWYDQYRPKDFGHGKWGYDGMLRDRRVANQLDRHPITGKRFRNPLEMRAVKNACFLGLLERDCDAVLVNYDTVSAEPSEVIEDIAALFEIATRGAYRVPGHVGAKGRPTARVTKGEISAEDFAFVKENIDFEQEIRLGFRGSFEDL